MALYRLVDVHDLDGPLLVAAFDGWVDAGSASTTAAARIAGDGGIAVRFDSDELYDYRARRPTLEIVDGRPFQLTWPELLVRRVRLGTQDVLVMTGPEPDYRWHELADAAVEIAQRIGVSSWISLGAIPAAVPHTRPVPILGTASRPGLLLGDVPPGPEGLLRVPAAAISVLDVAVSSAGIPSVGYFAQIPHYVNGHYPAAAVELLRAVARHVGSDIDVASLEEEAREMRTQLDAAAQADGTTKAYVERLESMVDEARQPSGDDLISEIERFLREGGSEGRQRP